MTAPTGPDAPLTLPSWDDPVVRAGSTIVGGPVGRHARIGGSGWWTPVRVVLALAMLTLLFGWVQKSPCRDPAYWQHEQQYTRMCYSDVSALYFAEHLNEGKVPYLDHPVEYPVVIGGVMQVAAMVARVAEPAHRPAAFFDVTALILAACGLVVVVATLRAAGPARPWDAAMVAVAPGLLLHAYTNWDLVAAALAALAVAAWARRRPVLAGVWIGLGTATKLYPALLLVVLLFLCLRSSRMRAWAQAAAAAAAAWVLVNLPVYLAAGHFVANPDGSFTKTALGQNAWWRFYSLNRSRGADWDSWWLGLQHWPGWTPSTGRLNVLVALLVVVVLGLVGWLVHRAPRRPRLGQVAFLALAGFLLVNKVDSPQYVIWLLPLAVLARPRWPAFLAWQATEVLLLFTRFYFFICNDHHNADGTCAQGIAFGWFETTVLLRDAALLLLMALVVRDVLHPELDVVRRGGVDDPAGGVFDGAPDRHAYGEPRHVTA